MGPSGTRCQEWLCRLIANSKLLLCSTLLKLMIPTSRRRRQKGSVKTETVKNGLEYQGTRTRNRLRWQDPAAYAKDRTVLWSEGAPTNTRTYKHLLPDWMTVSRIVTDIFWCRNPGWRIAGCWWSWMNLYPSRSNRFSHETYTRQDFEEKEKTY
jgi:hypothetical protein